MAKINIEEARKLAKLSQDIAAGAVLLSATTSAIISLLIYGSKIYQLYYN